MEIKGVAPLVGAWIEINIRPQGGEERFVAPLVGAWIEIQEMVDAAPNIASLPSWERGLK